MRFVTHHETIVRARANDEARVIVPVLGFGAARRNDVAIEVEDFRIDGEAAESGLFFGFSQCHRGKIGIAIGVSAELQPAIELAVVRKEDATA